MRIETLTAQILDKMPDLGKWQRNFMLHLFLILMIYRGRHNFENLSRYGGKNELTYRSWYAQTFDFLKFNTLLIQSLPEEKRIIAFDPVYLSKSGKHTCGVAKFWSGCDGQAKYGLEFGGLASIGVESRTALHLSAYQTVDNQGNLLTHYASLITEQAEQLRELSTTLVADAYFSKKPFVDAVVAQNMRLISKFRQDVRLNYYHIPNSKEKVGRGRPRKYGGKVNKQAPDLAHFSCFYQDDKVRCYEGVVHAKALNRAVKCVLVQHLRKKKVPTVQVFFSTDAELSGQEVLDFYGLRFQIEFLYRDAKQHLGLAQCQARSQAKLHTHVNACLTAVSLAKVAYFLALPKKERKSFSLASIKTQYFNAHLLERFFQVFGINAQTHKKTEHYQKLHKYGCIAA